MDEIDDENIEDVEESFYKVKQGGDLEKYDNIEKALRESLAALRIDENNTWSIIRGAIAITRLKLFLYKYEGKQSEKAQVCVNILQYYKEDPVYYLNSLMEAIPRKLRIEYGLGLKKKYRKPWQQGNAKTNVAGVDLASFEKVEDEELDDEA